MPRRKRSTAVAPAAAETNPFHGFATAASAIDGQYREALKQIEDSGLPPEHKTQLQSELGELLEEQIQALCMHRGTTRNANDHFRVGPSSRASVGTGLSESVTKHEERSATELGGAE